jgi:hypothetical protein
VAVGAAVQLPRRGSHHAVHQTQPSRRRNRPQWRLVTIEVVEIIRIRIVTTDDNSAWADNGPQRGLLEMSPVPSDRCGEIRPPSAHVAEDTELCDWRPIHESIVNQHIACCH